MSTCDHMFLRAWSRKYCFCSMSISYELKFCSCSSLPLQPISPINILNPQASLSSVLSLDPVSELNQFEETENEMGR